MPYSPDRTPCEYYRIDCGYQVQIWREALQNNTLQSVCSFHLNLNELKGVDRRKASIRSRGKRECIFKENEHKIYKQLPTPIIIPLAIVNKQESENEEGQCYSIFRYKYSKIFQRKP